MRIVRFTSFRPEFFALMLSGSTPALYYAVMPRRTPDEALDALKKEEAELKSEMAEKRQKLRETEKNRRKDLAERMRRVQARLSAQERRQRTRRLILIGTLVEHEITENPSRRSRLNARLDAFLTRDRDRELFGLKPLKPQEGGEPEASSPAETSTAAAAEDERGDRQDHAQ